MRKWPQAVGATHAFFIGHPRAVALARVVWLILLGFALVWWLDPALKADTPVGLLWRNALPVSLVALLLYGLSGRFLFSAWLTGALTWLVFVVNALKEREMNAPLMPGDWVLRDQVLHHMNFFSHYAAGGLVLVLGLILFIVIGGVLWWSERRWSHPAWLTRVLLVLLPVVLLYTAFHGDGPWQKPYSDAELVGFQPWDPVASTRHTGVFAGLVRMTQNSKVTIPAPDTAVVANFAKEHAQSLQTRAGRTVPGELPDIVVVQSEAFFQPEIMKQIGSGAFTPNFERLAATGITGSLRTPAYGGGTIRTEFEALTGYPMLAFPSVTYPYYGLASRWMPSVPRRLQSFGYSTTLIHPFRGDFWNRQEVMPALGFQHSYYEEQFTGVARAGLYVADSALFNFVLDHLKNQQKAPSYTMLITMENHGPWGRDAKALPHALDGYALPKGLSVKGAKELTYYLSHLVNGDVALGDFSRRLMARPRWTILVFYGDHLPSLDNAFEDVGFDDGQNYAYQHTRYMVLSNRPLQPRQLDLSAYQLPALLFDTVGLPTDGYLAFDGAIRQAEVHDRPEQAAHYGQVYFDAAQMEVRCRHKLSLAGTCRESTHPIQATP